MNIYNKEVYRIYMYMYIYIILEESYQSIMNIIAWKMVIICQIDASHYN